MAQLRLRHCCNYCASLARAAWHVRMTLTSPGRECISGAGCVARMGSTTVWEGLHCGLTLCGAGRGSRYVLMALGIDPLKNEVDEEVIALGLDS